MKSNLKKMVGKRVVIGVTIGAVAFASLTGAMALRKVYNRPGEAALKYVPADSVLVAVVDLVPSPSQTLAFKHIDDSLSRNQMDKILEGSILELADHSKTTADLRPLVQRSGTVCLVPKGPKDEGSESGLIFLSVSDGVAASKILEKDAFPKFYKGLKYYKTGKSSMLLMVIDDYLVLTDRPEQYFKVKAIQSGEAQPITTVADFNTARHSVAEDANVIVYVSPKMADLIMGPKHEATPNLPQWFAMGVAVRDGGIGLSLSAKSDTSKNPSYQTIAQIQPVRQDLFDVLPSGSYGMMAMSSPSSYYDVVQQNFPDQKQVKKQIVQMEDSVLKGTGLSVEKDLLPALKGDTVAALYPSDSGDPKGMDVLMLVDDTNGASPAEAMDRFHSFMEQQIAKEGNGQKLFNEKQISGGREFRLNDKAETDIRKSIGQTFDAKTFNNKAMAGDKTIVFAMVGKALIVSSSQTLLDRAVASYESKTNGLTGDPKFGPYQKTLLDGNQTFAAFSLARIAEGVRNTVNASSMEPSNRKIFNGIIDVFASVKDPLSITGKNTSDGMGTAGVFIPIDYDKLIDLIGDQKNKKS